MGENENKLQGAPDFEKVGPLPHETSDRWGYPPTAATRPALNFYKQHSLDAQFIGAETIVIRELERTINRFGTAIEPNRPIRDVFPRVFESLDTAKAQEHHNRHVRKEVIVTRYVDNYLAYLAELLGLLLCEMPKAVQTNLMHSIGDVGETLKGGISLKFEEILAFESMDELVRWMAEKKVQTLSREGFFSMARYFKSALNLDLLTDRKREKDLVRAISTRNLLTHKRGILDSKYIRNLKEEGLDVSNMTIGERINLIDYAYVLDVVWDSVSDMERQVVDKFAVPISEVTSNDWWLGHTHDPASKKESDSLEN